MSSHFKTWLLSVLLCASIIPLNAQFQSGVSLPDLLRMKPDVKSDVSQIGARSVPLDSPVNPAEYFVGPGDMLALNIWSSAPAEYQLTVTPEASLLIPTVGAVDVRDQTLESLKKSVAKLVGKRYPNAEVTLTLLAPRKIVVQITGEVLNETKFELTSLQRVDNLIASANELPQGTKDVKESMEEVLRARQSVSLRNIIIQRRNGVKLRVDLVKYQTTGEGKYNPYLREGDQVFVPARYVIGTSIGVFGGVRLSGNFEFVEGDSLADLIAMGFGFKATADSQSAVLTRLSPDGNRMEAIDVNPLAILTRREPDIALRPGDRLIVKEIPESRQSYIVVIDGEVQRPGRYPITSHATKLSEIINASGGFTGEANIKAATLTRARVSPQSAPEEIALEQLLSSRSNLGLQDTSFYLTETALRLKGEIVSVDFHRLFVLGDSAHDVTLRNYDIIRVPQKTKTVYVFGQVRSPGHIEFIEGKDYKYYVQKAAGFAEDARTGEVKIIKGSTRAWLDPGETEIEDGDYVWVPKDRQYPFSYYLNSYAQVFGIIGTIATVALLINNFSK